MFQQAPMLTKNCKLLIKDIYVYTYIMLSIYICNATKITKDKLRQSIVLFPDAGDSRTVWTDAAQLL